MLSGTIYYLPAYGLGNIIQTTPAVRWLQERFNVLVVETASTRAYVRAVYSNFAKLTSSVPKSCRLVRSANPGIFKLGGTESEVVANLKRAGCLKLSEEVRTGFCAAPYTTHSFDLVLANGYNKSKNKSDWVAKTYGGWERVRELLPDLSVATVGLPGEHVPGTVDLTGLTLEETLGVVKAARCFASNDTGLYHAAAAFGVPGVVVFTFTDTAKNYDPIFHRSIKLLARDDLSCRPCQLRGVLHWNRMKPTCGWRCREVAPELIADEIRKQL